MTTIVNSTGKSAGAMRHIIIFATTNTCAQQVLTRCAASPQQTSLWQCRTAATFQKPKTRIHYGLPFFLPTLLSVSADADGHIQPNLLPRTHTPCNEHHRFTTHRVHTMRLGRANMKTAKFTEVWLPEEEYLQEKNHLPTPRCKLRVQSRPGYRQHKRVLIIFRI